MNRMRIQVFLSVLVVLTLALPAASLAQERGRDGARGPAGEPPATGLRERAPDRARERAMERLHQPPHVRDREQLRDRDIYGSELMTPRERREYRSRIEGMDSPGDWARFRAEHQARMQRRAEERGVELERPHFGQQLMTDHERDQLHRRLRDAPDDDARQRLQAEHRERMLERAREHRIPAEELEGE